MLLSAPILPAYRPGPERLVLNTPMIARLSSSQPDFPARIDALRESQTENLTQVDTVVAQIIADVRARGDDALLELTRRFDRSSAEDAAALKVPAERLEAAARAIDPLVHEALTESVARVKAYHERQLEQMGAARWEYEDTLGNRLGQMVRPMSRVGIYAPGGKATYPSTVIMTAVPARVAGVAGLVLTVPAPGGDVSDVLLAAAHLTGIDEMYLVGGAQAIAALAFGTDMIGRVDKIVGPGNAYVAAAKRQVFGAVGIDMVAGPSEVLVVADDTANVDWLVLDLFAQAEHDEQAQAVLVTTSEALADKVVAAVASKLPSMPRADVIRTSLRDRGAVITVQDDAEALELVNLFAPEHLELAVADPERLLEGVQHAGAVFLGQHSAEVVGDYTAGPSHVLPTAGTARFASPLGVYDFLTRTSIVGCSPRGAVQLGRAASILAREEGLHAHAEAAEGRVVG